MKKGTRRYIEHHLQKNVMNWVRDMIKLGRDELELMHSIPNGGERPKVRGSNGQWYCPEGKRLNKEGLKKGMPDLCLPISRGQYLGLYIEMKAPGPKYGLTTDQKKVMAQLREAGHCVEWFDTVNDTCKCIDWYLKMPKYRLVK
jgi:hypothetical protein